MNLIFPVQVPKRFKGTQVSAKGRICAPDRSSGWKPRIWDSFTAPRGQYRHHAIDIVASEGSQIRSATSGSVLTSWRGKPGAGWSEKGGWYVWIKDPAGYTHYYSHMQKRPRVKSGQKVVAGQLLGYVGRTGNAITTCPHLHYAITNPHGRKINPYPTLKPLYNVGAWVSQEPETTAGGAAVVLVAAGFGAWWLWRRTAT